MAVHQHTQTRPIMRVFLHPYAVNALPVSPVVPHAFLRRCRMADIPAIPRSQQTLVNMSAPSVIAGVLPACISEKE